MNNDQPNPKPFVQLVMRGHRPRLGKLPRVLLASTTVDTDTKQTLADWQGTTGHNLGGILDASVTFAKLKGFPRSSHRKSPIKVKSIK